MDISKFQEESDLEFEARKLNTTEAKEALVEETTEAEDKPASKVKLPSKPKD